MVCEGRSSEEEPASSDESPGTQLLVGVVRTEGDVSEEEHCDHVADEVQRRVHGA